MTTTLVSNKAQSKHLRLSLPLDSTKAEQIEFYKRLSQFQKDRNLLVTEVAPSEVEERAFVVTLNSKKAQKYRAAYIVAQKFEEAYKNTYVKKRRRGIRRTRTRRIR